MQINIQEKVRKRPEFEPGLNRAVKVLEEEIAPSRFGGEVVAEWTLNGDDANGQDVQLRMSDSCGSFTAQFSPRDLNDDNRLLPGIRRLWRNLLTVRIENQGKKIEKMLAELDADEDQ